MSNLADKTEYRALRIIAHMVKEFERLHGLDMTKTDDWDACTARNLLEGIYNPAAIPLITTETPRNH